MTMITSSLVICEGADRSKSVSYAVRACVLAWSLLFGSPPLISDLPLLSLLGRLFDP
jgi:hypothetical protein